MYPFEFEILWALHWAGDHPRPARDILPMLRQSPIGRRSPSSLAPTLCSLRTRGLLESQQRRDGSLWALTAAGREYVDR